MMDRLEQAVMRELRSQLDEAEKAADDFKHCAQRLADQLDEARAECEKWRKSFAGHLYVPTADYAAMVKARDERDALRAAIEANNAKCRADIGCGGGLYLIRLPPSAAPAASEPSRCRHGVWAAHHCWKCEAAGAYEQQSCGLPEVPK